MCGFSAIVADFSGVLVSCKLGEAYVQEVDVRVAGMRERNAGVHVSAAALRGDGR